MSGELSPTDTGRFNVLIVCTANLCRSPLGEHLLRHAAGAAGQDWLVHSAGLAAVDGRGMHPRVLADLAARRVDVGSRWSSHAIHRATIAEADLVLTATSSQASAVVDIAPKAMMRTFPLRQFARLCVAARAAGLPMSDGASLLDSANRARTRIATVDPAKDDIRDPIRRSAGFFRRRSQEIALAVEHIVAGLAAERPTPVDADDPAVDRVAEDAP